MPNFQKSLIHRGKPKVSEIQSGTNLFCQEQAVLLKQNNKGPSPKLGGPGFSEN